MMAKLFLADVALVGSTSTLFMSYANMIAGQRQSLFLAEAKIVDPLTVLGVDAGPAITSDPFELITLSANVTGSPDGGGWTLESATNGAVPVLIGSGPTVTYWAPPRVNGTVLTWRYTATKTANLPVSDTVVHTILNHGGPWFETPSGRIGVKISAVPGEF